MEPTDYEAIRCGMNVSKAIIEGSIDAGIGLENVQMVELEEWLTGQGRPRSDVQMLRIDELAELGCCCFCSILYIGMHPQLLCIGLPLTNGQRTTHSWPKTRRR
jgi:pyrimidine precursor biosynthesis enzyme